jgi:NADH-quinone oxidoreductase subunit I
MSGAAAGPGAPGVPVDRPARTRGVIALVEDSCTVCMLCVRECPDWCIEIDSHVETLPATEPRGRDRSVNVLDRFAVDYALCMYCGICVEVCPFDALHWSPVADYAGATPADLVHERDRLGAWEAGVPPRPALDPAAAPRPGAAPRPPSRP